MMSRSIETSKWKKFKEDFNDPVKRKVRNKKIAIIVGAILRAFILIGLCFVIVLPIFEKISTAIRHPMDLSDTQVIWIPTRISALNFQVAGKMLSYWTTLGNTFILSLVSMIIQIMATAVAGYAFARLKFKGNNILFYIILFTIVVPNEAMDRSRTSLLNEIPFFGVSLIGNIFSMYIMAAFGQGIRSAIFIFLFRQFFKGIPLELEESAQVDGAGVIRTFWSVMLPNARGAIVTVGLFAFVWQWNDCYFGQLLGYNTSNMPLLAVELSNGTEQLRTIISTFLGANNQVLGSFSDSNVTTDPTYVNLIANTAALMMMAPLLIGYFFIQKLFVESIERTGLVG